MVGCIEGFIFIIFGNRTVSLNLTRTWGRLLVLVVAVFGSWCLEVEQVVLLSKGLLLLLCCC